MIDTTIHSGNPSEDEAAFSLGEALAGIEDHVAVYDRDWRYVYLNHRGAEVLGRTREELLGQCLWEVFPDAVGNQYWRELHQAVAEGRPIHSEHHYLPWDRWYENHIYPFPGGVCVLASDITERKRAQLERESLLLQLEAVARQMPAAVMIADAVTGTLVFCNERVFEILGYDLLKSQVNLFDDPSQIEGFRPDGGRLAAGDWPIARVLRTGEVVRGEEIEIRRLDGKRLTIEVNAGPVRDGEGRITAGVVVFGDVTERKRAEEALREADRRKNEFLAMLGHELRNPLAPIRNAVEVLGLLGASEPRIDWCREVIDRQVSHLSRLVDDLLDISRITQGKVTLQKEAFDLAMIVSRAVETTRPLIEERGHRLILALPREPVLLEADLVRLAQVLANLLNNAAKYTPEGGEIRLSAESEGQDAVIRVSDNGLGIPPAMINRVFELFVQGDQSLARSEGGLGIGLTLVRSLVEMHGGTVEARSDGPGRGSEMVVRLPVLVPERAESRPPSPRLSSPSGARRILVVDDNQDSAESLAFLLELQGHEVRAAFDGPQALDLARSFEPHLVVLDIGLPRMDGYEVALRLREERGKDGLVLIALTGYGQEEDLRRSREAGFDHHLVKPADLEKLQELLRMGPEGGG